MVQTNYVIVYDALAYSDDSEQEQSELIHVPDWAHQVIFQVSATHAGSYNVYGYNPASGDYEVLNTEPQATLDAGSTALLDITKPTPMYIRWTSGTDAAGTLNAVAWFGARAR